jgi:predicted RNase H-like nuclease (RuvC/YqgF family)
MSRNLLVHAVDAVETARDATTSTNKRDRLEQLGSQLQAQTDRDATPALGALDRIQTKLRDIEDDTDEETVTNALAEAREHILSFLGTLDDRGMKQHRGGTGSSTGNS